MGIVVIILATFLCSWRAFRTNRTHMLYCGMLQNSLFALYWGLSGEHTAMSIAAVGVLCTVLQNFISQFSLRFMLAMTAAFVAYYISHDSAMDIIPLLAFSCSRFGETFSSHHHMRMGYQLSALSWLVFSIMTGDVVAIASNGVIALCQAVAILHTSGHLHLPRFAFAFKRVTH